MEIYRENINLFLNMTFMLSLILIDPLWLVIKAYMPFSFLIPLVFGMWMGHMDQYIDWTLI